MRHQEAEPNAENATLEEMRVAMEAAPNRRSYIRLAVMRSLLMGLERSVVAKQFCRTDRVVRLWIEMFNTGGIDALTTKGRRGRARRVKLEGLRDLLVPVLENPSQAGELHWTGVSGFCLARRGAGSLSRFLLSQFGSLGWALYAIARPDHKSKNIANKRA